MNNSFFWIVFSFLIVAFGQPAFIPFFGLVAAICGYGLFWRSVLDWPSKMNRFWTALIWYAGVQAVQLSWMSDTKYQGIYIIFVHATLSLILGLQFAFFTLFIKKEHSILTILALSGVWTLVEWSRFFILCGLGFNQAGMALSAHIWPLQMASFFGILGLSFWVIFVNQMMLRLFVKQHWKRTISCGLLSFFPYVLGFCALSYHQNQMERCDKTVSILLIQTGLLPSEKVPLDGKLKDFISPYQQWKKIVQIVKQQRAAEIIVLPEAAVPFNSDAALYSFEKSKQIFKEMLGEGIEAYFPAQTAPFFNEEKNHVSNCFWAQTLSNYLEAEVIIGLDHYDSAKYQSHNSAFHFWPKKEEHERYDKKILIPLAEYLPFKWLYPLVKNYGITDFFSHGKEHSLFNGCIPLAVSICYEETFPHLMREGRLKGAQLFVNLTNDGWYPCSKLAKQHFDHARLRAVENGVGLVRSCNTGITGAIDSNGQIISLLPEFDQEGKNFAGAVKIKINSYHHPTLYTFWGNGGIISVSVFFIILFLMVKIRGFIKGKNH